MTCGLIGRGGGTLPARGQGDQLIGRFARRVASKTLAQFSSATEEIVRREIDSLGKERNSDRLLYGAIAANQVAAIDRLPTLGAAGFRVFSQFGEDGIIEWLVSKLPMLKPSFVEFGVESYTEANTIFLLQRRNWRGLIADIGSAHIDHLRTSDLMWRYDLQAVQMPVRRDNVNSLFTNHGFGGEIGILSIDIDGNDYWIWDTISATNPGIVICEYNAVFGDVHAITVPLDDDFDRTSKHHSNLYWGASIEAWRLVGERRGYVLVGTTTEGNNAFFVRRDIADSILDRILDRRPMPSRFRESRDKLGALTYLRSTARLNEIAALPVVDVRAGQTVQLSSLAPTAYSEHWRSIMA